MKRVCAFMVALMFLTMDVLPVRAAVVLDIGSRGENVRRVQAQLIKWGYMSGTADGVYGAKTRDAVRKFQSKNKLPPDGRVGPATAAKLGVILSASGSSGSSGARTASAPASSAD